MTEGSIARRYSRALIEIAREQNKLSEYGAELKSFFKLCEENSFLMDTLTNRFFDLSARLKIVDELTSKLGSSKMVQNFIKVLIKKGRIGFLADILKAYEQGVYELQNKMEAFVTSAQELGSDVYSGIKKILSENTKKEIVLKKEIKPEVIGGVRVRLGGLVYDGTIKSQLDGLTQQMKESSI